LSLLPHHRIVGFGSFQLIAIGGSSDPEAVGQKKQPPSTSLLKPAENIIVHKAKKREI